MVTATAADNDGNFDTATDDETVTFTDVLPVISVVKTANPTSLLEPGGVVTFTVTITNDSEPGDPVTITSLVDDIHGDLDGQGTCSIPQTLQPGESFNCQFTAMVEGAPGTIETDVVTAIRSDDEETPVEASDDAEVRIVNDNDFVILMML